MRLVLTAPIHFERTRSMILRLPHPSQFAILRLRFTGNYTPTDSLRRPLQGQLSLPAVFGVTEPYLPLIPLLPSHATAPDGKRMLEYIRSIVLHGLPGDEKRTLITAKGRVAYHRVCKRRRERGKTTHRK